MCLILQFMHPGVHWDDERCCSSTTGQNHECQASRVSLLAWLVRCKCIHKSRQRKPLMHMQIHTSTHQTASIYLHNTYIDTHTHTHTHTYTDTDTHTHTHTHRSKSVTWQGEGRGGNWDSGTKELAPLTADSEHDTPCLLPCPSAPVYPSTLVPGLISYSPQVSLKRHHVEPGALLSLLLSFPTHTHTHTSFQHRSSTTTPWEKTG